MDILYIFLFFGGLAWTIFGLASFIKLTFSPITLHHIKPYKMVILCFVCGPIIWLVGICRLFSDLVLDRFEEWLSE